MKPPLTLIIPAPVRMLPCTVICRDGTYLTGFTIPEVRDPAVDWIGNIEKLTGRDLKDLYAIIPIPITPGYQRLYRKESLT